MAKLGYTEIYGAQKITGQIISLVSTGTAPLVIGSTTKVTNLNADLLDGYSSSSENTANTIALRDSSGDLKIRLLRPTYTSNNTTPNHFMTQVTPGDGTDNYVRPTSLASVKTAVVTSAAVVAGLGFTPIQSTSNITGNASNVTGTVAVTHGGTGLTTLTNGYVLTGAGTGNVAMVSRSGIDSRTSFPPAVATGRTDATFYSVPWHSGNALYSATNVQIQSSTGTLKANILESSIVTGTAPFTVASTTMVDNLYVK